METGKANDVSSSHPDPDKRLGFPECGRTTPSPGSSRRTEYPQTKLGHSVTVVGDIVDPGLSEEHWESLEP